MSPQRGHSGSAGGPTDNPQGTSRIKHFFSFTSAAIADDGNDIVLTQGNSVLHWRTRDSVRPLSKLPGRVTAVAISRDGRRAAAANIIGATPKPGNPPRLPADVPVQIRVWELATNAEVFRIDLSGVVASLAFDEAAHHLLVNRSVDPLGGQCAPSVSVWDVERRRPDLEIPECAGQAVLGPRGEQIVTHSLADGRIRIWNSRGTLLRTSQPIRDLSAVGVSPDNRRLVAGTAVGLELFDFESLDRLLVISTRLPPRGVRFSADGSKLVEMDGPLLRAHDAMPAYNPDVRTAVRQLLMRRAPPARPSVPGAGKMGSIGQAATASMWVHDIEEQVSRDENLAPVVRETVIDELRRIGDRDVVGLCNNAAGIASRRDASPQEYQLGLRNAERGTQLAPWSAFCVGTLGMAKYRTQDYAGALELLSRAKAIRGEAQQAELAFQAMAFQRLGRPAEALVVAEELQKTRSESDSVPAELATELALTLSQPSAGAVRTR